jgi:hypothetical protein
MATARRTKRPLELSADDARRIAIVAQGLTEGACANPGAVLRRTHAVQLDTISVLARSHELVAYARLGAVPRASIEDAYWGRPARAFEYYAHANCIIPVEDWPYYAFRRRSQARKAFASRVSQRVLTKVRARLAAGPVTATDLGGARRDASGWWNWSDAKRAVELMTYTGDVVCTTRRAWKRVYDLPDRAIAARYRRKDPSDEECYRYLVRAAVRALGVATRRDIADYYRLTWGIVGVPPAARALLNATIDTSGFVPASVEGWAEDAYADRAILSAAQDAGACRTTLLSPFDSLIWDRPRTKRLFGVDLKLEAYTPKADRVHGYFTMLLLHDGRIVGRVDPAREKGVLVARHAHIDDRDAIEPMATALSEAATWVNCEQIRVDRTSPPSLAASLRRAL